MKACLQMQPEFCSREKLFHYFIILFILSFYFLFQTLSVQHMYLECQMIFDCSVAGDVESFVCQNVDFFVIGDAEGSVAVGIGDSVAEGFVQSGAEGFGGYILG